MSCREREREGGGLCQYQYTSVIRTVLFHNEHLNGPFGFQNEYPHGISSRSISMRTSDERSSRKSRSVST